MDRRAQQQQEEQYADAAAVDSQAQIEEMQAQMAEMQAQQVQNAAAATPAPQAEMSTDLTTQLQQLAQLKESGMLTDDEFQAAKTKLLAT